jgi:hypothetical protein
LRRPSRTRALPAFSRWKTWTFFLVLLNSNKANNKLLSLLEWSNFWVTHARKKERKSISCLGHQLIWKIQGNFQIMNPLYYYSISSLHIQLRNVFKLELTMGSSDGRTMSLPYWRKTTLAST